jgi:zinc D-Ala-D-Ala carboxypeptidase
LLSKEDAMPKKMMSKHFSEYEMMRSNTASQLNLDNKPNVVQKKNMQNLVDNVLEPARMYIGKPIHVNSGYRSKEVNKAVGGSKTSDHMKGMAADITCTKKKDNKKLFKFLQTLDFKQLIWYYMDEVYPTFIHISFDYENNKKQELFCYLKKDQENGLYTRGYQEYRSIGDD